MNNKYLSLATMLRVEICIPFLMFEFPISLILGVFFAVSNYLCEYRCFKEKHIKKQVLLLLQYCLYNGIALSIGLFLEGKFFRLDNSGGVLIKDAVISAMALIIIIPACVFVGRIIFLFTDTMTRKLGDR